MKIKLSQKQMGILLLVLGVAIQTANMIMWSDDLIPKWGFYIGVLIGPFFTGWGCGLMIGGNKND